MPATLAARLRVHLTSWTTRNRGSLIQCTRPRSLITKAAEGCLLVTSEDAMACLAQLLQSIREEGDCICLYGNVGAGKSTFCRSYVRAACCDPFLAVPSPTFLLKNAYEPLEGPPVHHYDLYRLKELVHTERLDLPASFQGAATLIEWPQIAHPALPANRLNLHIAALPADLQCALKPQVERVIQEARAAWQEEDIKNYASDSIPDTPEEDEMRYTDLSWRAVTLEPRGLRWTGAVHAVLEAVQHSTEIVAEGLIVAPAEVGNYLTETLQAAAGSASSPSGV